MSENVKKYLTMLYPNYESATKEEQEKIKRDKEFIEKISMQLMNMFKDMAKMDIKEWMIINFYQQ